MCVSLVVDTHTNRPGVELREANWRKTERGPSAGVFTANLPAIVIAELRVEHLSSSAHFSTVCASKRKARMLIISGHVPEDSSTTYGTSGFSRGEPSMRISAV